MHKLICFLCGKPFERRQIRTETKYHFCSRKCYDEARQTGQANQNFPGLTRWASIKVVCTQCGKEGQIRPSYKAKSLNHFCSQPCYKKWWKSQALDEKMQAMRDCKGGKKQKQAWCRGFIGSDYQQERHLVPIKEFVHYRSSIHRHSANGKKKLLRKTICRRCDRARSRDYFSRIYYPANRKRLIEVAKNNFKKRKAKS